MLQTIPFLIPRLFARMGLVEMRIPTLSLDFFWEKNMAAKIHEGSAGFLGVLCSLEKTGIGLAGLSWRKKRQNSHREGVWSRKKGFWGFISSHKFLK